MALQKSRPADIATHDADHGDYPLTVTLSHGFPDAKAKSLIES
jgi:hypothetical protein